MIHIDVIYTDDGIPKNMKHWQSAKPPMPPLFQTFKVRSIEEVERYLEWPVEATKADITYEGTAYRIKRVIEPSKHKNKYDYL